MVDEYQKLNCRYNVDLLRIVWSCVPILPTSLVDILVTYDRGVEAEERMRGGGGGVRGGGGGVDEQQEEEEEEEEE